MDDANEIGGSDDGQGGGARLSTSQSADRYRTLFDQMDEGFCIIEFFDGPHGPLSDYVHVEANAAYARHAGIANVVGQKLREMVGDEADAWVARYGAVLKTGQPIRFEQELVATGRHLELSAFRVEPPELNQVAVLFQDLTARKNAEQALKELNDTLEHRVEQATSERMAAEEALRQSQKMEALGQLTGGLAHDFNNLLGGISGSLELIQKRIAEGRIGEVDKYLAAAQGAARRAAALTHRLLAFGRRQALAPEAIDVNRQLVDFAELVRRTVGPEIDVRLTLAPGLWPVKVDSNQLENALLNLCINARDAMPGGGVIKIGTANRTGADPSGSGDDRDMVEISVRDTGSGIAPENIDRVFDPFFTTKPLGVGTGLGLSMVHGFGHQSGGSVDIHSPPGEGTCVRILLPRHQGEATVGDAVPAGAVAITDQRHQTVLVIDDEAIIRLLIVDALEEEGIRCLEADAGAEGLALLEAHPEIDLLVTDVGLPGGLNGRQVADRARELRPGLGVLFVTGYADRPEFEAVAASDHTDLLTKPFLVDELKRRVDCLLGPGQAG